MVYDNIFQHLLPAAVDLVKTRQKLAPDTGKRYQIMHTSVCRGTQGTHASRYRSREADEAESSAQSVAESKITQRCPPGGNSTLHSAPFVGVGVEINPVYFL
jgi:hypothetical protein